MAEVVAKVMEEVVAEATHPTDVRVQLLKMR